MITAVPMIRRNPVEFLERIWREHGDIAQFPIPRPPTYLITDPAAVREILVDNARDYSKRTIQYTSLSVITGNGLLTVDDPPWREHRRVIAPAFHSSALAQAAAGIGLACDAAVGQLRGVAARGEVVDLEPLMMRLSLDVVASALFGADWRDQARDLTSATAIALDEVVARARNPLAPPLGSPTPGARRLRRSLRTLNVAVEAVIRQRLARDSAEAEPNLLDLLIADSQSADPAFDLRAVRDEVVTFLVAGHETVACALTWIWQLLADNPAAAGCLTAELERVLSGRQPRLSDVPKLKFTRAIMDEALRLFPPAWVITRKATADHHYVGLLVPADSLIIISPSLVHRHRDVWDDPESFEPQRFLADGGSHRRVGYLPFGLGPRMCIGRDLALLEGTLCIATLASQLELLPVRRGPVNLSPSVTLRPTGGMPMRVRLRS